MFKKEFWRYIFLGTILMKNVYYRILKVAEKKFYKLYVEWKIFMKTVLIKFLLSESKKKSFYWTRAPVCIKLQKIRIKISFSSKKSWVIWNYQYLINFMKQQPAAFVKFKHLFYFTLFLRDVVSWFIQKTEWMVKATNEY